MSTAVCPACHRPYWRYSRNAPGAPRYCSQTCRDNRPRRKRVQTSSEPPQSVLGEIRRHLQATHGTSDILTWFNECRTCEELQQRYAAALADVA